MTASFSAALMGSPPETLFAPSGASGAIEVAAIFSVMLSTADIFVLRDCSELEATGRLFWIEERRG